MTSNRGAKKVKTKTEASNNVATQGKLFHLPAEIIQMIGQELGQLDLKAFAFAFVGRKFYAQIHRVFIRRRLAEALAKELAPYAATDNTKAMQGAINAHTPRISINSLYKPETNEKETILKPVYERESRTPNYGYTPLQIAVINGSIHAARYLLQQRADVHAVNDENYTALSYAVIYGTIEMVQLLCESRSDINHTGCGLTPLHLAVERKQKELVQYLLNNGANVHAEDLDGDTPLDVAVRVGNLGICRILQCNGAAVNHQSADGSTALHLAASQNNSEIVQFLLEKGAKVYAMDKQGCTAVHTALYGNSLDLLRLLHQSGGDINCRDGWGYTLLEIAAGLGNLELIRYLLEHGADVHTATKGDTALVQAIRSRRIESVRLLCKWGSDIHHKDRKGRSPLEIAVNIANTGNGQPAKDIACWLQAYVKRAI